MQKISIFYQFILDIQFQSLVTRLAPPISDQAYPKKFNQLLIFVNFYRQAKNQGISSIGYGFIDDLNILKSD